MRVSSARDPLVLNGPRRAQAASHLPSSIGPMPEAKASARTNKQAHAVTSRVTSWAFWFALGAGVSRNGTFNGTFRYDATGNHHITAVGEIR